MGGRLRQWDGTAPFTEIINAPVQGTSADITKLAIAELPEKLQGTEAKLLMQVHDEIVLEVPAAHADRAGQILVQTMVAAGQQFLKEVPVEVEAVICDNWAGRNARPVPMLEAAISAKEPEPNSSPPPARSEEMKQLAATLRELPLNQVAQNLGLTQDKRDAQKWTNEGHTISLYNNNHRFSDWATGVTGKYGAIDLVMHVQGSSYKNALSWLAETQNLTQVAESAEPMKRPPTCNVRDESQWQGVQQYLTEERRLSPEVIETLHEQGILGADSRQNVMFFRHELLDSFECGAAIGANLRGTIPNAEGKFFKGLTPGTRREDGFFWIQQGEGTIDRVVLTESPIDAISLAAMDEARDRGATVYLSTDGRGAIPVTAIQQVLDGGGELILAQDSDRDGNRQAWSVVPQFPEHALIRIQPEGYKDWNDCLRDIPQPAWEGQAVQPSLPDTAALFTSLRPALERTAVPLRLPSYIPIDGQRQSNPQLPQLQVYAVLDEIQPNQGYQITLGYTPDCSGGNACRLGTFSGEIKPHQSIEDTYAFMRDPNFKGRRSQEAMAPVSLSRGIQGWFIPWICGANCNDAKVVWEENIYRYSVGIKLGDRASLVKMANSAIEAGDP